MSAKLAAAMACVRAGSVLLAICCGVPGVLAQGANAPPNALQGFSQNRDQPISIESATLEVREKEKIATFSGNVKLVQGDTTLTCKTLTVFYEGDSVDAKSAKSARAASAVTQSGGSQRIKRIEAKGGVRVTQKDQTATGDSGIFEMASNTVTLIGSVAMTQGPNVVKGDRLWIDLNSGRSRVESGSSSDGRVRMLVTPGSFNKTEKPAGEAGKSNGKPAAGAAPSALPGQQNPKSQTSVR